jgi:predicted transcriptional regulator
MKGERSSDNVTRKLLSEYIMEHPGITFQMLSTVFNIKESTLRYHLEYLQSKEQIVVRKKSGLNVYFSNLVHGIASKNLLAQRKESKRNQRILSLIKEHPGISRDDLKEMIALTGKDLTVGLYQLKEKHQIWEIEKNGKRTYEAITRERLLDEVLVSLVRKLVDGEIDEGTFLKLKDELDREKKE